MHLNKYENMGSIQKRLVCKYNDIQFLYWKRTGFQPLIVFKIRQFFDVVIMLQAAENIVEKTNTNLPQFRIYTDDFMVVVVFKIRTTITLK